MEPEDDAAPSAPLPIDEGRVAQSIVEYTGQRMGTVTYRGRSSGREYRFDASRWHKRQYVLDEDLDLFRAHSEFQVRPEGRIDHDADEQRRREETMARLLARVDELEGEAANRGSRR